MPCATENADFTQRFRLRILRMFVLNFRYFPYKFEENVQKWETNFNPEKKEIEMLGFVNSIA